MFERYTEKARRVIFFSRYEAAQVGSISIETEHLLLGIVREYSGLIDSLIGAEKHDEFIAKVRGYSEQDKLPRGDTSIDLPLSSESKRVLAYAAEEAEGLLQKHIGPEHLLLGLLREEGSLAASLLHEFGVRLDSAREQFRKADLGQSRVLLHSPARSKGDGLVEFVDEEGQRVGISGLTKTTPRVGEFVCLRRDDLEITYRVVRVTYEYYPEPPGSPHAADLLRSIRITVTRAGRDYKGDSVPIDAT